ncbi:MAG: type II secretion system protein [Planctomycetes bacterium]|nr:type II secretion system protein [Planctomycetota bacterium]
MNRTRGLRTEGFSLIEVMFALTIVTTALVGLFSAILHISRLNAANRENLAALRGAEMMIETLRSTPFDRIFASYNSNRSDDPPPGPGSAPGPNFDVLDLVPQPDDADQKCGKILFPTDAGGTRLLETTVDPDLMMPRDLNMNGKIDSDDVSATAVLLPVTVRIDWQGVQGRRTWTCRTVLLKKK